jgi:hypothetical protein
MYTILAGTPPIKSFPNDDKIRVVWAQSVIYKNLNGTTNVPNAEIMLKEVLEDGSLKELPLFVYVAVAELDAVRPMTIWKGNRKTEQTWDEFKSYESKMEFSFNFDVNQPESIKFTDKKQNSQYSYFPPYVYSFGTINDKAKLAHCLNSRFTKITTESGIVVLIPSLEFLTSTFTPYEKIIRDMLLQYPLEKILDEYINFSYIKDDKYYIELKKEKVISNEHFLAYAKFNKTTKSRLKALRNSCEKESAYQEKYPVVLPYHPSRLDILADGIWIDKETFFAFRVTDYSLPTEEEIVCLEVEYETLESDDVEDTSGYRRYPKELDDEKDDIPLGNDYQPHTRNGSKHIVSEVGILNINKCNIRHEKISVETRNSKRRDFENIEDINELSSSEAGQSEESKNVGKAKQVPKTLDKTHLRQSDVLNMVKKALNHMISERVNISSEDNNVFVKEILFVDEDCTLNAIQMATQFSRALKSFGKKVTPWVKYKKHIEGKRAFTGYRNYLLIKIVLTNGKSAYMFEIDRKDENESFLGMIFSVSGEINNKVLADLLYRVMEEQGVVKKVKIPGIQTETFRHKTNKEKNLNDNIQSALKKAMKNGLFG